MPIYEYRCPNGHTFEVFQRMSDPPVGSCETCGAAPVEKVLFPVAVHFKGSGFYSTDYGKGSRKGGRDGDSGGSDKGGEKTATDKKESSKDSSSGSTSSSGDAKKASDT
jgi:putative FmdB family regulatory protein